MALLQRKTREVVVSGYSKVGATAGWTVGGGAVNIGRLATCPASQTASTLVVPVMGLEVGDVVEGFYLNGQIESASGAVTLDAALRKTTAAAADLTDAAVASMTQISASADTAVNRTNSIKTGFADAVGSDEQFYFLITATTAASTDIDLAAAVVIVRREVSN